MNADQLRSIACGPEVAIACAIGAGVFHGWLANKWARQIPERVGKKGSARVLREHETSLRLGHILSVAAWILVLITYEIGWFKDNDWRGVGVCFGFMGAIPSCCIIVANRKRGIEGLKEGFAAYSIFVRLPRVLIIIITLLFIVAGVASVVSLLVHR